MTESKGEELHWEQLAAPKVAELAKRTNVALVPLGCIESHGPVSYTHLRAHET